MCIAFREPGAYSAAASLMQAITPSKVRLGMGTSELYSEKAGAAGREVLGASGTRDHRAVPYQ